MVDVEDLLRDHIHQRISCNSLFQRYEKCKGVELSHDSFQRVLHFMGCDDKAMAQTSRTESELNDVMTQVCQEHHIGTVMQWVKSIDLHHILAQHLLFEIRKSQTDHGHALRHMVSRSNDHQQNILENALNVFVLDVKEGLRCALDDLRTGLFLGVDGAAAKMAINSKFSLMPPRRTGTFGKADDFFGGLEGRLGFPSPRVWEGMKAEHLEHPCSTQEFRTPNYDTLTCPATEWEFVVNPVLHKQYPGYRQPRPLAEFMAHTNCSAAGLTEEEVAGLRLYTGPMYVKYNAKLRRNTTSPAESEFVTTLHCIASGIIKLSRIWKLPATRKVYRGLGGNALPEEFWEADEFGGKGAVELGFMSTTTVREVALDYSGLNCGNFPTIFEISVGQVDRGASLDWLSQYPAESEILFPPLSNLEVVDGMHVEHTGKGPVLVIPLRVNVNVKCLTLEQLKDRRRALHGAMLRNLVHETRQDLFNTMREIVGVTSGVDQIVDDALEDIKQLAESSFGEELNDDEVYREQINMAMDTKKATVRKFKRMQQETAVNPTSPALDLMLSSRVSDWIAPGFEYSIRAGDCDIPWNDIVEAKTESIEIRSWKLELNQVRLLWQCIQISIDVWCSANGSTPAACPLHLALQSEDGSLLKVHAASFLLSNSLQIPASSQLRGYDVKLLLPAFEANPNLTRLDLGNPRADTKASELLASCLHQMTALKTLAVGGQKDTDLDFLRHTTVLDVEYDGPAALPERQWSSRILFGHRIAPADGNDSEGSADRESSCRLRPLREWETTCMFACLEKSNNLTELNLARNAIKANGAQLLGSVLRAVSSLVSLDLSHNEIGPLGATAVAGALLDNQLLQTSLRSLDLQSNDIFHSGDVALKPVLANYTLLSRLDCLSACSSYQGETITGLDVTGRDGSLNAYQKQWVLSVLHSARRRMPSFTSLCICRLVVCSEIIRAIVKCNIQDDSPSECVLQSLTLRDCQCTRGLKATCLGSALLRMSEGLKTLSFRRTLLDDDLLLSVLSACLSLSLETLDLSDALGSGVYRCRLIRALFRMGNAPARLESEDEVAGMGWSFTEIWWWRLLLRIFVPFDRITLPPPTMKVAFRLHQNIMYQIGFFLLCFFLAFAGFLSKGRGAWKEILIFVPLIVFPFAEALIFLLYTFLALNELIGIEQRMIDGWITAFHTELARNIAHGQDPLDQVEESEEQGSPEQREERLHVAEAPLHVESGDAGPHISQQPTPQISQEQQVVGHDGNEDGLVAEGEGCSWHSSKKVFNQQREEAGRFLGSTWHKISALFEDDYKASATGKDARAEVQSDNAVLWTDMMIDEFQALRPHIVLLSLIWFTFASVLFLYGWQSPKPVQAYTSLRFTYTSPTYEERNQSVSFGSLRSNLTFKVWGLNSFPVRVLGASSDDNKTDVLLNQSEPLTLSEAIIAWPTLSLALDDLPAVWVELSACIAPPQTCDEETDSELDMFDTQRWVRIDAHQLKAGQNQDWLVFRFGEAPQVSLLRFVPLLQAVGYFIILGTEYLVMLTGWMLLSVMIPLIHAGIAILLAATYFAADLEAIAFGCLFVAVGDALPPVHVLASITVPREPGRPRMLWGLVVFASVIFSFAGFWICLFSMKRSSWNIETLVRGQNSIGIPLLLDCSKPYFVWMTYVMLHFPAFGAISISAIGKILSKVIPGSCCAVPLWLHWEGIRPHRRKGSSWGKKVQAGVTNRFSRWLRSIDPAVRAELGTTQTLIRRRAQRNRWQWLLTQALRDANEVSWLVRRVGFEIPENGDELRQVSSKLHELHSQGRVLQLILNEKLAAIAEITDGHLPALQGGSPCFVKWEGVLTPNEQASLILWPEALPLDLARRDVYTHRTPSGILFFASGGIAFRSLSRLLDSLHELSQDGEITVIDLKEDEDRLGLTQLVITINSSQTRDLNVAEHLCTISFFDLTNPNIKRAIQWYHFGQHELQADSGKPPLRRALSL